MAKKIIWTPEAEKTFAAVIDYLQQHWSNREIQAFIERVNSVAEHIKGILYLTDQLEKKMYVKR